VRATLPIGAGLGSSAALSVCISTALLYLNRHLSIPPSPVQDSEEAIHHGRRAIPNDHAKLINAWAYLGEKINHGSPSGVDNACASFGDAIAFQRSATSGVSATMESLHGFQSLRFLLTNTKVPRNTKALVAHVGELKKANPERIEPVFDAIHRVSEEARKALTDAELPRAVQLSVLEVGG
jgi:mevalonate kinase